MLQGLLNRRLDEQKLFNTPVGDQVYIILEKNGVKAADLKESLQMASMSDYKTGRHYLHNLDRIIVGQAANK